MAVAWDSSRAPFGPPNRALSSGLRTVHVLLNRRGPATLSWSVAACMRLNDVVPSCRTAQSLAVEIGA